ncbi:hypothetical protein M422DRAFT_257017 [Sphaerobolus stellatus SS14]|uniref:Uncharacterized protein n=1 Tax=Sphaerobolus stellatus (strain SS14) TaxID=990650 RepID=A0A0C9UAL7_SPHS4|nr:hypothetical protein M422DRAFT_257017 [Sphaerobolus stellatus SS14]
MIFSPKKKTSWELVERKAIAPVMVDDEYEDLDVVHVSPKDVEATYVFDVPPKSEVPSWQDMQRVIVFARQQYMKEASAQGWNTLLKEGWEILWFRKSSKRRLEVKYSGRPALVSGLKPHAALARSPPFLELLRSDLY